MYRRFRGLLCYSLKSPMVHGGVYKPVYVHLCVCMCIHVGGLAAFWMHGRGQWNQKAGVDWCVRSPQPSLTQTQGNTWQSPQDWLWDTSMSYQKELHSQGCSRDLCPSSGQSPGHRVTKHPTSQLPCSGRKGGTLHTVHIIRAKIYEQLPCNSAADSTNLFFQRGWVLNLLFLPVDAW